MLKMKTGCILFLACVAYCMGASIHDHEAHQFKADKTFLERQKQILKLCVRIQYPTVFKDIKDIADTYKLEDNLDKYNNQEDVKKFVFLYNHDKLVPRGEIPTLFEKTIAEQVRLLFDVFYNANDYETFYKTACWARNHVNEGIFMYTFTTAVYAREDTKYMKIPPIYEVYPYLFVNEKVIQTVIDNYMTNPDLSQGKPYVIDVNSTGCVHHERNDDELLSYFTEDVGLNAFNYYWHIHYPQWYNSSKYGLEADRRGELFLHVQHQLLSRYFMERMSNFMEDVPYLDCDKELPEFHPKLRYHTGESVPGRPAGMKMVDTDQISMHYMEELFARIRTSIDRCYVITDDNEKHSLCDEKGMGMLGDILYSFLDNPNMKLYGSFYNFMVHMIGYVADPDGKLGMAPSAVMTYMTMLRDPVYYQMINTMYDEFVYKLRKNMPTYKYDDLAIPGVKIDNVDIDKLVTYYDDFYTSLNQVIGVKTEDDLQKYDVRAKQHRLNHKPFTYQVSVTSDKEMDVLVRVYLVPFYDIHGRKLDYETRAVYPVEIDRFPYKLTAGQTVIERNSKQSTVGVSDPDNFRTLFKKVEDALNDKEPLMVEEYDHPFGFPQRLLLPKGWKSGMPVRLVVVLEPYLKVENGGLENAFEIDSVTMMGVPYGRKLPMKNRMNVVLGRLPRSIFDGQVPNSYRKEVLIYHKTEDEMRNVVQNEESVQS